MKKRVIPVLLCIIVLLLALVFIIFRRFYYNKPEKDLTRALDSVMAQNAEEAGKYLDYQAFYGLGGDEAVCRALMRDFSYQLDEMDQKNKYATAHVTVTNRDIESIYGKFVVEAYQLVISEAYKPEESRLDQESLRQEINTLLVNNLNQTEAGEVSSQIDIEMVRSGRSWYLMFDDSDYDAIYGGYLTARSKAEALLGDMSAESLKNIEDTYQENIDDTEHVLRNAVHFVVEDIWNQTLCNIVSCINAGTASDGQDYNLKEGLKTLDSLMTQKVQYDVYISGLTGDENQPVKDAWNQLSEALSALVTDIKTADPEPTDYDYIPDTSAFETELNKFVKLIYQAAE